MNDHLGEADRKSMQKPDHSYLEDFITLLERDDIGDTARDPAEALTMHRRGHWFKSGTAHHTVQYVELLFGGQARVFSCYGELKDRAVTRLISLFDEVKKPISRVGILLTNGRSSVKPDCQKDIMRMQCVTGRRRQLK